MATTIFKEIMRKGAKNVFALCLEQSIGQERVTR